MKLKEEKLRLPLGAWNTLTLMANVWDLTKSAIVQRAVVAYRRLSQDKQRVVVREKRKPTTDSKVVTYTLPPRLKGDLTHGELVLIVAWKLKLEEPALQPYLGGKVTRFKPQDAPGSYVTKAPGKEWKLHTSKSRNKTT